MDATKSSSMMETTTFSAMLVFIGWIYISVLEAASPCSCIDLTSSHGGNCDYLFDPWCYVKPDAACSDKEDSGQLEGHSWSYQACQKNNSCTCNDNTYRESGSCHERGSKYGFMYSSTQCQEWSRFYVMHISNGCTGGPNIPQLSSKNLNFSEINWEVMKVIQENEDGTIQCEDVDDCFIFKQEALRTFWGLGEEWNPEITCSFYENDYDKGKLCILDTGEVPDCDVDKGETCFTGPSERQIKPLRFVTVKKHAGTREFTSCIAEGFPPIYTSASAGQSWLPAMIDLADLKVNYRRQAEPIIRGTCSDPKTCRRGDLCCPIVWAGSNRNFICPHTCFFGSSSATVFDYDYFYDYEYFDPE